MTMRVFPYPIAWKEAEAETLQEQRQQRQFINKFNIKENYESTYTN